MIHDSLARPDDPRINGVAKGVSGEATTAAPIAQTRRTLPAICYELRGKIDAFLREDITDDDVLRSVQAQVGVSMGVIEEALRRYG